jgi:hypothetical protein
MRFVQLVVLIAKLVRAARWSLAPSVHGGWLAIGAATISEAKPLPTGKCSLRGRRP